MSRLARYAVGFIMVAIGVIGLTVTEPVEGVGAPMPDKVSASKERVVRDVTVNLGGKRTRVVVKMGSKSESFVIRRTRGKLPARLPICTEDYDMSGHKYGCRGADYLGRVSNRDVLLDYVVVPVPDKRYAAVIWSNGMGEVIFR